MTFASYMDLAGAVRAKIQLGRQDEALELLAHQEAAFPLHAGPIYLLRAELYAEGGRSDAAIASLSDALEAGCRYKAEWLRGDRALSPLAELDAFAAIVDRADARFTEEQSKAKSSLSITEPKDGAPRSGYPVLIVLHGNNSNVRVTEPFWTAARDFGWLLALPQSAEIGTSPESFTWNDRERTGAELERHLATLRSRPDVDPRAIVIAGFSMGGTQAIALALTRRVDTRGVFVVGAYLPHIREFGALIEAGNAVGLRFYLVAGANDASGYDGAKGLVAALNRAGVAAELDGRASLGHEYPTDMSATIQRGLAFIGAAEPAPSP